jgi:uncharacterized membrane protein YqhA
MTGDNSNSSPSSKLTLGVIRLVMGLAVAGIFIGSTFLLLSATLDIAGAILTTLLGDNLQAHGDLRLAMIEAVDTILVSTVLYVIAIGLYQLFVGTGLSLPGWLQTNDVGDLEGRLAGMVVTVISVIFLTQALESEDPQALLYAGLGIAAVISAISIFLYVEGKHKHPAEHDPASEE